MRELTLQEVDAVGAGLWQVAATSLIGGVLSGINSSVNGDGFWGGFWNGAVSGALIGSGVGLFATSAVAGTTMIGAGSALSASYAWATC